MLHDRIVLETQTWKLLLQRYMLKSEQKIYIIPTLVLFFSNQKLLRKCCYEEVAYARKGASFKIFLMASTPPIHYSLTVLVQIYSEPKHRQMIYNVKKDQL